MIEDWGIGSVVANALGFSTTAFASGAVTDALGHALENTPAAPLAYLIFFIILPVTGFFSDTREMIIRGLIFTVCVIFFSSYIFNDIGEVVAAIVAFIIGLVISLRNE